MFHAFSCLQTTVWLSYFNDYPCTRQENTSRRECFSHVHESFVGILNLPIPGDDWDFHLTIQPLGFCNMRITCSGSSWSKLSSAWRFPGCDCTPPVGYLAQTVVSSGSVVTRLLPEPDRSSFDHISWYFPELVMHYRSGQLSDELWGPLEEMKWFGAVIQNHTSTHEEHTYGHWFFSWRSIYL